MKTHCFFAHIAFATDARVLATAKATANLLIEINDIALTSGAKEKHLNVSTLTKPQKVELAGGIARAAARDYLKLERAFRKFPVQQFVDFNLAGTPPIFRFVLRRPKSFGTVPKYGGLRRVSQIN